MHFAVEYTPDNDEHYQQVAKNYLRSKGVQTAPGDKTPVWVEIC